VVECGHLPMGDDLLVRRRLGRRRAADVEPRPRSPVGRQDLVLAVRTARRVPGRVASAGLDLAERGQESFQAWWGGGLRDGRRDRYEEGRGKQGREGRTTAAGHVWQWGSF